MTTATHPINLAMFREVYADAVCDGMPTEDDYKLRSLHWHGPRVSLAEAAELYAEIDSYNEFRHDMIAKLAAQFPHDGIEATPAREYSVAVYLHFPTSFVTDVLKRDVRRFVEENFKADEIDTVTKFSCLQDGEDELNGEALRIWWD